MKANAAMLWLLALLSLLGLPAQAQTSREMRKQIEASMLVVGTVDIDRSGEVTAHALDNADKLPASVVGLVDKAITQVRFEPILVVTSFPETGVAWDTGETGDAVRAEFERAMGAHPWSAIP